MLSFFEPPSHSCLVTCTDEYFLEALPFTTPPPFTPSEGQTTHHADTFTCTVAVGEGGLVFLVATNLSRSLLPYFVEAFSHSVSLFLGKWFTSGGLLGFAYPGFGEGVGLLAPLVFGVRG